jgi:rfaE bifunctional protein nucleotidyltransferase chain/domain
MRSKIKVGDTFGRLTVVEFLGTVKRVGSRGNYPLFSCVCKCGSKKNVFSYDLGRKHVKSCGCLAKEVRQRGQKIILERNKAKQLTSDTATNAILNYYIQNSKRRGLTFELTPEHFKELISKNCSYCGCLPFQVFKKHQLTKVFNGIDRIDNSIGYIPNNVKTCCGVCNRMKGSLSENDFLTSISRLSKQNQRIVSVKEAGHISEKLKKDGKKIVVATGCMDIFHFGHLSYLKHASTLGDILIVGLDNDKSVSELKGLTRPINNESHRIEIVSSLRYVDFACVYPNTKDFLQAIKPNVWVKGADYTLETLNKEEKSVVITCGGCIEFAPHVSGLSTTGIINKIK